VQDEADQALKALDDSDFESKSGKSDDDAEKKKDEFGAYDDGIGGLAPEDGTTKPDAEEVKAEPNEEDKIIVHPLYREIDQL
jgi:hypothetical protein